MYSQLQSQSLKDKVDKLLSQMSLLQKIGQMTQAERLTCTPEDVKKYHLGSVLSGAGSYPGESRLEDWVNMNDDYWLASMDSDGQHMAIPIIYGLDAIHGNNNVKGATIFPHNIGLGAANDVDLIERIANITASEVLAAGVDWTFAPNLAVAKDIRWGRTYESYSENPENVASYAERMVKGLQAVNDSKGIVACVKHWVGDGGTEHGIDHGDTLLSLGELENDHIFPYNSALEAGAMTVMASYSSWNGEKCHGHKYLLTDILKKRMKFDGFVISDMQGIDYLTDDFYLSVALGVNAGIDMFMLPDTWKEFIEHLQSHVELGTVSMVRVDDAVRRILSVKIACGLFDAPRPKHRPESNHKSFGSDCHRDVAREAVRKSLVLLKNESNILPLNKQSRVLVAGKNANNIGYQCGGFTGDWQGTSGCDFVEGGTSIWDGIKNSAEKATLYESGRNSEYCSQDYDVAIIVIGEIPYAEGVGDIRADDHLIVETGSQVNGQINIQECYGDSLVLARLHPEDNQVIKNIKELGIPIVTVLISGRPLLINRELEQSKAFVAAWLPGSEGHGISDVLFGDYHFHGELSFNWPNQPKTVPSESLSKLFRFNPLRKKSYQNDSKSILFPIGFGLKY